MAIRLEKGQRINLEKETGAKLTNFCVGCNWGAIVKKTFFGLSSSVVDVDLDLSCLMFDAEGKPIDHIYSPLYRFGDRNVGLPNGKVDSVDHALHHTGDDTQGDQNGDDGLDNEIITVDLNKVSSQTNSIVFFLNIYNNNEFSGDFSENPMHQSECMKVLPQRYIPFLHNMTLLLRIIVVVCERLLWASSIVVMASGNSRPLAMLLRIETSFKP